MDESYRALFVRGKPRQLVAALGAAWLSFGMVGLALFLTTHRATGSYVAAGAAVAAFSVGSGALAPLRGRLVDRRGLRPWLLLLAGGYATALATLDVLAQLHSPVWMLDAIAAAAGLSAPPLIASLRAMWPTVVEDGLLRRAYAVTSVIGDVGLVVGPALVGVLFVWRSWLPLVLCALGPIVAALLAIQGPRIAIDRGESGKGSLLVRGFVILVAAEVALGIALGTIEVAVPAVATSRGSTAYSGLILAAFGAGSVLGGIWFGRRNWTAPPVQRYLVAALLLAASLLLAIANNGLGALAVFLLIAGLSYGPATISLFEALDDFAASRATEAFTWITTSGAVGTAAGAASAGWLTTTIGLWAAFVVASSVLGLTAAFGLTART